MLKFRVCLALCAALILSACYPPMTQHPVGGAATTPDPILVGLWKGEPADSPGPGVYVHFLPSLDGTFSAVLVQAGSTSPDWYYVTLTTTKLGGNRFMNARIVQSNGRAESGGPGGTLPILYRARNDGEISLFTMDEPATKAAILAGKIKGTVEKGEMGDAVITADPAALDVFLGSPAGLKLFSKLLFTLHRME